MGEKGAKKGDLHYQTLTYIIEPGIKIGLNGTEEHPKIDYAYMGTCCFIEIGERWNIW